MTARQRERLRRLFTNPPPGSKIAAAKEYGVDLTLLLRNLELTPNERVKKMEAALEFLEELRAAFRTDRR